MNSLQWLQVLASFAVQATLVIGIAWGMERWSNCPKTKSRVWSACFVSLLLLIAAGVLLPRLELLHPWSALAPTKIRAVADAEKVLGNCLLAIWACGSAVIIARQLMQFIGLRAFIARCPPLPAEVQARLRDHIPGDVSAPYAERLTFREGPRELGPFCYQFHLPIIFLPATLVYGSERELEHVLRHEVTHLNTRHPMQLLLQRLVQIVLWFHPLVWIGGRRSSLVREFVCDDAAGGDAPSAAAYLRTLLRLVEDRSSSPGGTLMFGRTQSELKLRARRLAFESDRPERAISWAPAAVCFAAIVVSQLWLPTNPLASRYSSFSPWPTWTAKVAHAFGVSLRDFESFDDRLQVDELINADCKAD